MNYLVGFAVSDEGQGMTEYGLILAVFVVAVIGALIILGPKIAGLFTDFNDQVN